MKKKHQNNPVRQYRPSPACSCDICKGFCRRPGWWTVDEAEKAFIAGFGGRMMLEVSPELSFGVLAPAFKGCERNIALQSYASLGCCFFEDGLCQLHGTGHQPLECRVCHHARPGVGARCHADIEKDWQSPRGQVLVNKWAEQFGILEKYGIHK
jgi:hypothetical protein